MLQRRLTGRPFAGLLIVTLVALAACGDEPIEDNLVRPGITAIEDARHVACGVDATALRTAIDAYAILNDEPPSDEAALVDAGFLRQPSDGWDVADGELVAQDPACATVVMSTTPTTVVDIVTDDEAISAEELLAGMTADQIGEVGGIDCARELVEIFSAAERFIHELDREPADVDDLVTEGFLDAPPSLWIVETDDLRPAEGSGCIEPLGEPDDGPDCQAEARTLETAVQAYIAMNGPDVPLPTEADLVTAGMLRDESDLVDLDADGEVVAAPGSGCDDLISE